LKGKQTNARQSIQTNRKGPAMMHFVLSSTKNLNRNAKTRKHDGFYKQSNRQASLAPIPEAKHAFES
jgi:hypothetical protein